MFSVHINVIFITKMYKYKNAMVMWVDEIPF